LEKDLKHHHDHGRQKYKGLGTIRAKINNEDCRHKLFQREVWGSLMGSMGQSPRKLMSYTTEMVTFFIILEVLLTT
jgi:hypothetical protein